MDQRLHENGGWVVTNSCNSGEHISKLFEKYAQTEIWHRQIGAGFGLAFCLLAIQAHGGQIGVESAARKGSTFDFTIPLSTQELGQ